MVSFPVFLFIYSPFFSNFFLFSFKLLFVIFSLYMLHHLFSSVSLTSFNFFHLSPLPPFFFFFLSFASALHSLIFNFSPFHSFSSLLPFVYLYPSLPFFLFLDSLPAFLSVPFSAPSSSHQFPVLFSPLFIFLYPLISPSPLPSLPCVMSTYFSPFLQSPSLSFHPFS